MQNATTTTASNPEAVLIFLPEIIGDKKAFPPIPALFRVSRSTWLEGVKSGRYPQPVRLSQRIVAWRRSDILALIAGL